MLGLMFHLSSRLQGNNSLPWFSPGVKSKVRGVHISLEKKEGVLGYFTDDNSDCKKPATIDSYYEITIHCDGTNPDYPQSSKPVTWRFTKCLKGGQMMIDNNLCIASDTNFSRFILRERFFSLRELNRPDDMGWVKRLARSPRNMLTLDTYIYNRAGKEVLDSSISFQARKSEQEVSQRLAGPQDLAMRL